jgi:hypothetical protein
MTKYFTSNPIGFLDPSINIIPKGAVEITDKEWQDLLAAQSNGQMIQADSKGNPEAVDRPPPTNDQLISACKKQAQLLLSETDWVELPSVSDSTNNPYLINVAAFIDYRNKIRVLAVNPIAKPKWATVPTAQWSS